MRGDSTQKNNIVFLISVAIAIVVILYGYFFSDSLIAVSDFIDRHFSDTGIHLFLD